MKGTINLVKDAVISISMTARAANVFAQDWLHHRNYNCFSTTKALLKSLNKIQVSNMVVNSS